MSPALRFARLAGLALIVLLGPVAPASPLITQVVETGGLNEPTDTVTAKHTGETFSNGIPGEFPDPYTVPPFGEDVPAFVDRIHQWNGATAGGLPPHLVGGEYIMIGNDNRPQPALTLDVTVSEPVTVYLLIDNRLTDGNAGDPPEGGAPPASWTRMQWVGTAGFQPVRTGANRFGDPNLPDEVGLDEAGDGLGPGVSIQSHASVYFKTVPAGTVRLGEFGEAGSRNMYGVVVTRRRHQALTWVAPAPGTVLLAGQPYPLQATADTGLTVTFRVESGPAILLGGAVYALGSGTVVLVAEQAGDATYGPGQVRKIFTSLGSGLPITETQDRVAGRIGAFLAGSRPTVDGGGHTSATGDRAADFGRSSTGPVHVSDGTFLNAFSAHDELSVSFWQKRYDAAGDSSFWFNSTSSGGVNRGAQAHVPWGDGYVVFDTSGCCGESSRVQAPVATFPDYSGNPVWWQDWHFFVFSKKGSLKKIWIDGKLFLEGSNTAALPTDFTDLAIGGQAFTDGTGVANMLHGVIDDFAIYGTALSEASIDSLFAGSAPTDLAPSDQLAAYWDFDEALTWVSPAPDTVLLPGQAYPLLVAALNGLPVTFRVEGGPAIVAGDTVTTSGPGPVVLVAEQAGDATHPPASMRRTFNRPSVAATPLGEWPGIPRGVSRAVSVAGDLVYLAAEAAGLVIVDASNPANPLRRGGYLTPDHALGLSVTDGVALVAARHSGLHLLDVRQPDHPVKLGSYDTPGQANAVAQAGNLAFVADGSAGLQIIDLAQPANPLRVGAYDTSGESFGVAASGTLVLVADGLAGLQIFDASNPASPSPVGSLDTAGSAQAVAVSGTLALVADGPSDSLLLIDFSQPSSPVLRGTAALGGYARGVTVSEGRAWVAANSAGLRILDISQPANPVVLGVYHDGDNESGWSWGVAVSGNRAFVADWDAGLRIIDASQPASPVRLGSYDTSGASFQVALSGDLAFVADGDSGLQIFDTTPAADPIRQGGLETPGQAEGVALAGNLAFVADGYAGLQIVDVSLPTNPVRRGTLAPGGYAHGVTVSGSRAYLAADWIGLKIVDVTAPATPLVLGGLDTPGVAMAVAVAGEFAFVADGFAGLQVIDVKQPSAPHLAGGFDTSGYAAGVAVSGNLVFVADSHAGLQIIDVSQPANPTRIGTLDTPTSAAGVALRGNLAFVADRDSGVQIIDVGKPVSPVTVGRYDTRGTALGIAVSADRAFVADGPWGLQVLSWRSGIPQTLDFHPPAAVPPNSPPVALAATATSGLPVTYSVADGPALLAGNQLTTTATGTVILRADQAGNAMFLPATTTRAVHSGTLALRPGYLKFEAWNGLSPSDRRLDTTLLADPRYPAFPDFTSYTSQFGSRPVYPDDSHQGYGGRISGFLTPPVSGDYRFFVSGDDSCRLYLSTDDQPANLVPIAEETACCHGFTEPDSPRTSAPIPLEAGRRYYVEGLWKETGLADFLHVAWRREGDPTPAGSLPRIPASALSVLVPNDDPPDLLIADPAGNLTGDTARTFLDILFASARISAGRYTLEMENVAPFPTPAEMGPDRRLDLIWFVDADRDTATGQSAAGNDYNIHLYLDGFGWNWRWYKVSPLSTQDGITIRPEDFQITVNGSRASLSFPANYLPQPTFNLWAWCMTGNSANWPPLTANPWTATATFDVTPPVLLSSRVRFGDGRVALGFDDPLDPATALAPGNYKVNGVTPSTVVLWADHRGVDLTLPPIATAQARVIVSGLADLAGNTLAQPALRTIALRFAENFESVTLGPNKDEALAADQAWTHTPPSGWSIDNSQFVATLPDPNSVPPNIDEDGDGYVDQDGVTEWAGWSLASKDWWIQAAADQRRSEFTLGTGVVAVADTDEWDDGPHATSLFHSKLRSPSLPLAGFAPDSARLSFHSSWLPEGLDDGFPKFPLGPSGEFINNQTAVITASFDGAAPVEVLRWDSAPGSPTFHPNQTDELVWVDLPNPAGAQSVVLTFSLLDAANDWWWALDNLELSENPVQPRVVGRHVFYNQSFFDGNNAAANAADDAAIAPDKSALRPGAKATFANYTSYQRGLNGIMIDIAGLPGTPTAADFEFRVGNANNLTLWTPGPAPASVTVRPGAGLDGSDRVTLIWGADAPKKKWLQVTVLATPNTGLAQPDVFCLGNAIGETGNSTTDARVTTADALRVIANVTAIAAVANRYDINRDGKVGAADRLIILGNLSVLDPLILLDLTGGGALQGTFPATRTPTMPGLAVMTTRAGTEGLRLQWISDGTPVTLWTTESLGTDDWEILQQFPAAPVSGTPVDVVLPLDPDGPARFYRLESGRAR